MANDFAGTMLDYQGQASPPPAPSYEATPTPSPDGQRPEADPQQQAAMAVPPPRPGFFHRLADTMTNGYGPLRKEREEKDRQQQLETESLTQRNRQADLEYHQKLQQIARPVLPGGIVNDTVEDPTTGKLVNGAYRPADKSRTIKYKTGNKDEPDVEYELRTPEEQDKYARMNAINNQQAEQPLVDVENQRAAEKAHQTAINSGMDKGEADQMVRDKYGVEAPSMMGLPQGTKVLPSEAIGFSRATAPVVYKTDAAGARQDKALSSKEKLQQNQIAFKDAEDQRKLATQNAWQQNRNRVTMGLDPTVAAPALKAYDQGQAQWDNLQTRAIDLSSKVHGAQELLSEDGIKDGETYTNPFTGRDETMNGFRRANLTAETRRQAFNYGQIHDQAEAIAARFKVPVPPVTAPGGQPGGASTGRPAGAPAAVQPAPAGVPAARSFAPRPVATPVAAPAAGAAPVDPAEAARAAAERADPVAASYANYRTKMPLSRAGSPKAIRAYEGLLNRVMKIDPAFDENGYDTKKQAALKYAPGGELGNQGLALNTLVRHSDDLIDAVKKLGNGDFTPANAGYQKLRELLGDKAPTNFDQLRDYVSGETVKLIRGGGGSVEDAERASRNLDRQRSPSQLAGALETNFEVAGGKMQALNEQAQKYHLGKDFTVLDEGAKAILDKRGYDTKTLKKLPAGDSIPLKDGTVLHPKSKAAELSFRKLHADLIK